MLKYGQRPVSVTFVTGGGGCACFAFLTGRGSVYGWVATIMGAKVPPPPILVWGNETSGKHRAGSKLACVLWSGHLFRNNYIPQSVSRRVELIVRSGFRRNGREPIGILHGKECGGTGTAYSHDSDASVEQADTAADVNMTVASGCHNNRHQHD